MKNNLLEIKNFGTKEQIVHVYSILEKSNCTYINLKKVCTSFSQSVEGIISLLIELSFIFEKNNIFIKNNLMPLDYSYIRNLLLNLDFFIKDSFLVNTFQINSIYLDIFLNLYNLKQDKKIEYSFIESEKAILIKDNVDDSKKDIPPKVFISYS